MTSGKSDQVAARVRVHSIQQSLSQADPGETPLRQNRRTPLIEAALRPARGQFKPAALKMLTQALALVIGTEAMVVCKDVLHLDNAEALKTKRWAIRALVAAAKNSASDTSPSP